MNPQLVDVANKGRVKRKSGEPSLIKSLRPLEDSNIVTDVLKVSLSTVAKESLSWKYFRTYLMNRIVRP